MANKKYYMVLDTETCGDYVFDVGYRVIDRHNNCYDAGSFVVNEFITDPSVLDMFNDMFTRTKIGKYYFDLWANNDGFEPMPFMTIQQHINEVVSYYNATICAYNINFDLTHLDKTAQYFGLNNFFNDDINTLDIWHMAMSVLCTNNFIRFCLKHEFFTKAGNIPTGAEIMFKYISNNPDFEESHTAHEDCIIECAIMQKCFSRKRKFQTSTVGMCKHNAEWQRIQDTIKFI